MYRLGGEWYLTDIRAAWLPRLELAGKTVRAAIDAAIAQEGEAKQAREADRWLADGPDLNEEGDA